MMAPRTCVDCREAGRPLTRPAPHPGPRCATDWRLERKRRLQVRRDSHRHDRYGLTPEEYARLFEAQGRRCAICRRATGASKALAVDHDHTCCPGPTSCGRCVRGLLCGPCNSTMAHFRDDPELFRRAIRYLREWPALAI
jgi:Recombination endonuclease VII